MITDKDKWVAQKNGMDADYIPGLDDGESKEQFIKDEIAEDTKSLFPVGFDEPEIAQELPAGIY